MFDFQDILRVRNTAGIASVFILISVLLRAMIAVYHHYYYHCDDHTYNWDDEHHLCYCNSGGVDGGNVWDNYENDILFGGTGSMLPSKKMRSTSTMMKIKKQQIQKKKQMGSTYDEGEDEELDDVNIEDDEEMRRMKTNLEMGYIQQED
eukprot:CAMPEP_0202448190 /NCGR_PEP_ID=MMETSP1360-20130828/6998_1 /ASSEMBLY_ACC=CAM_ASM_000848 /TAXON_ID=515479 /ORGANISM="Licmophora paradoxa, Strain CCMP2313" /LENGTH=148 /DNA_ID=CAMNT_0049065641 /DNA_START=1 /DNA_END=447 /DNA_ORIENTATION=+